MLRAWSGDPLAGVIGVIYLVSVIGVAVASAILRDRSRWAPLAVLCATILALTIGGAIAGWSGFSWNASSRAMKLVGLAFGLGLPSFGAFVGVLASRRRGIGGRIAAGVIVGGVAALVAPLAWTAAVCVLTGDCL